MLGANLVDAVEKQHHSLVALSHNHSLNRPGIDQICADLRVEETVDRLLQSLQPAWIIHCAALTNVDQCEDDPDEAWRVNVEMTRHLAAAACRVRARMIYISTDSVFDGETGQYCEDDTPGPLNVYAKSKLAGESVVHEELKESLIIRTNIFGWNARDKLSLAEWILGRLEASQTINAFVDVIFSPILVNDLSRIILDMLKRELSGLYHVAGSEVCSKYEFAVHLANVFGLDERLVLPASVASSELKAPRPRNTSLQTTRICRALSESMPDVHSGLQRFKALRDSGYVKELKALS